MASVSSIKEILDGNHNYWIADQSNTLVKANAFTFYFEKFKALVSCFFLQDRTAPPLLEKALRKLVVSETYSSDLLNRTEQAAAKLGIKNLKKEKVQKIISVKIKEMFLNSIREFNFPKKEKLENSEELELVNVDDKEQNIEKDIKLASKLFSQIPTTKIATFAFVVFAVGYITDRLLSLSTSECTKADWTLDAENPEFFIYNGPLGIDEAGKILDACLEKVNAHNSLPLYSKISLLF